MGGRENYRSDTGEGVGKGGGGVEGDRGGSESSK